jgi:hypothetical protein
VRVAPNQEMAADWRVSPWGGGGGAATVENASRDRDDPGVQGRRTESRVDGGGGSVLERGSEEVGRKGERDGGRWLLTALGRATEGKRGRQGVRVWASRGGQKREERGGPSTMGDSSGGQHRPPAGGRMRRRCRTIVEGGGT